MGDTLARDQHIAERTGHGQAAIVDSIIQYESKSAVGVKRAQFRHLPFLVASDDQVVYGTASFQGALQNCHAFGTVSGTRERNPEICSTGRVEIVEIGEQGCAGNGPGLAAPTLAQQRGEGAPGVVRRSRTYQVYGWRRCTAANARAIQGVTQLRASLRTDGVSRGPGVG